MQPTGQPSTGPTSKPSYQPSSTPSSYPSQRPSTQPSGQPTGQPSLQPTVAVCPAGTFRNNFGDCILCPPGSYNPLPYAGKEANTCDFCPAGSFCDIAGTINFILCPQATYNPFPNASSIEACLNCPPGTTTPYLGAVSADDCLNPTPNFVTGFIALALAAVLIVVYIIRGRFHRVAFIREVRAVNKLNSHSIRVDKSLSKMIDNIDQRRKFFREVWYEGTVTKVYADDKYDIDINNIKSMSEVENADKSLSVKTEYYVEEGTFSYWRWFFPRLSKFVNFLKKETKDVIVESKVQGAKIYRPTSWYLNNPPIASETVSPFQTSVSASTSSVEISGRDETSALLISGPLEILRKVVHRDDFSGSDGAESNSDLASETDIYEVDSVGYFALDGNLLFGRIYSQRDKENLEKRIISIVEMELGRSQSQTQKSNLLVHNIANVVEFQLMKEALDKAAAATTDDDKVAVGKTTVQENVATYKSKVMEQKKNSKTHFLEFIKNEVNERIVVNDEENLERVKLRREYIVDVTTKYVDRNIRKVLLDHIVSIVREKIEDVVDECILHSPVDFFQKILSVIHLRFNGQVLSDEDIEAVASECIEDELVRYMSEDVESNRTFPQGYRILENVIVIPSMKVSSCGPQSFKISDSTGKCIFAMKARSTDSCDRWVTELRRILKWTEYGGRGLNVNDKVYCRQFRDTWNSNYRIFIFVISGILFATFTIFMLFVVYFAQIIFSSLIIWRGIDVDIDFLKNLEEVTRVFEFEFQIPFIYYLLYPLLALMNILSNINLNLASLNVTCSGAQAPLELVILCTILISVVLVIESRFSVFVKVFFRCLNYRYVLSAIQFKLKYPPKPIEDIKPPDFRIDYKKMESEANVIINRDFESQLKRTSEIMYLDYTDKSKAIDDKVDKVDILTIPYKTALSWYIQLKKRFEPTEDNEGVYLSNWLKYYLMLTCFLAGTIGSIDPMQRLLQYMMGFAPVSAFFEDSNVVHASSVACNSLEGVPNIDKGKNLSSYPSNSLS